MSKERMLAVLVALNLTTWGLFFLGGAAPARKQEVIEAKQFVLIDGKGKKRAELGFGKKGAPNLSVYDGQGNPLAGVLGLPHGGALLVSSPGSSPSSVRVGASKEATFLSIHESPAVPRIRLQTDKFGPLIFVLDEKKQLRIGLGLNEGRPMLELKNADGKELFLAPKE